MNLNISEEFVSFQGEGTSVGTRAYFIRFQGCNLRCDWCDTTHAQNVAKVLAETGKSSPYFPAEFHSVTVNELVERVRRENVPLVVITGGEPFMQCKGLADLLEGLLSLTTACVEIETNGTLFDRGMEVLLEWENSGGRVQINVSPKWQAEVDYASVLKRIRLRAKKYIVKFVIENDEDTQRAMKVISIADVALSRVYYMPEGMTREEQLKKLPEVAEFAKRDGVNLSVRAHVLIWDKKRGV
ncbi:MAG: 7-carboxy-7-deazaguanine synthase QueE [Candidatus Shapirobacteria bacterium]|jgi:7-carboxy-7-deazaguanine synthase